MSRGRPEPGALVPWLTYTRREETVLNRPEALPLSGLDIGVPPRTQTSAQQLSLLGRPEPVRIPAEQWRQWLNDPAVRRRFESKVYRGLGEEACWPWRAGISSTGHATFRCGSLPGPGRRGTVPAHLYAYQLEYGVIPRLGWSGSASENLCHRCDEHACQNPRHLRLGTLAENRQEWTVRHRTPGGPLADLRGAAGRARAVAAVIRQGLAAGEPVERINERIRQAREEGMPLALW
jgi:hypothetical protein